ncbi:CDP-diacylglycerol--glycerol-3-phosphate 3-phosphatidyltransferase [Chlamydia avium]|uniref:CDP-diacylglycerol--glycerol-3-phosphate 3-phosphatidyltransferase n=2 Tax=Chlamydia avium TaxID=1457141 RepID=W8JNB5_9CHLA|nr:CDP-alcohol phosphatidyltransferase family protein [Chlamydia avium]AHK63774.1 CDP-alcohol phosphatidyltransferase family protein [Chlamydia avium 10DC88]EPP36530.1 CDP-alcohol phosphatidyltransferase family protein [Chlamydia psittaci 10_743_SC13]EPP38591.1 CDP-alcohol phosphatidyltransferase family protein [Chlamydia avium]VVT43355.1 CDP-diacylglycerol--glycerol-3-phosphate 3-phosphatidyltransferase [Chlamydia avium]
MRRLCNLLSLSRIWLALLFCQERGHLRLLVILGAMASDVLDGYLARRYKATSRFGSMLDPLTDKFFVFVCVAILYWERSLSPSHLLLIFARDIFLVLFAIYLSAVRGWRGYDYRALFFGKIFTIAQFIILLGVTAGVKIPVIGLTPLIVLGCLYFIERVIDYKKQCLD